MVRLALPVIAAELGWMAMGVVDTVMVGPLGAAELGGTGIGSACSLPSACSAWVCCWDSTPPSLRRSGLAIGASAITGWSPGCGWRRSRHCRSASLLVAVWLALARVGFHPAVLPHVDAYFPIVALSLPPLLVYAALRRYLQALSRVGAIAFTLVSANLVNVVVNWILIYGIGPAPALGVRGAAWATVLSRVYMVAVLAWVAWRLHRSALTTLSRGPSLPSGCVVSSYSGCRPPHI